MSEDNGDKPEPSNADGDKPEAATDSSKGDTPDAATAPEPAAGEDEVGKWKALAKKHEKENRRLLAEAQERAEAELSELDKAKAAADKAHTEALDLRRRLVAVEHGLPAELATRLQGDTEDDLVEDAKRLAELVAPEPPKRPTPAEAGIGTASGEPTTDPRELHRQFLAGRQ